MAKEKKQFRELSDEELKQVTGGAGIDCSLDKYKNLAICLNTVVNMSPNTDSYNTVVTWGPNPKYS